MAPRAGNEKQDRTRESAHGVVVPADRGDGRDTLSARICRDRRPHAPRRRAVGPYVRYFDRAERGGIGLSGDFLWDHAAATADKRRSPNVGRTRTAA